MKWDLIYAIGSSFSGNNGLATVSLSSFLVDSVWSYDADGDVSFNFTSLFELIAHGCNVTSAYNVYTTKPIMYKIDVIQNTMRHSSCKCF